MSKNIAVICGGFSSEFEISVKSGNTIKNNLPDSFNTFLVLLTKEGWYVEHESQRISLNPIDFSFELNNRIIKFDLAIVYIHGDPGENGKVQAMLEIIGIPYINSGPLASQLSFDKWYCNQFLKGFDINVAKSILLNHPSNRPSDSEIIDSLGLPLFVKPADSGSSYGIAKVNHQDQLSEAIINAFKEGRTVVIESFLKGTEVTCGVYRNKEGIIALPLTEIVSKNEFFDFEAKYKGFSEEITPARIDSKIFEQVQETARKIYSILNLRSIARIDFMLVDNEPYVIEVNTTPGFSAESIVPKMIKVNGSTIKEFWQEIIDAEYVNN